MKGNVQELHSSAIKWIVGRKQMFIHVVSQLVRGTAWYDLIGCDGQPEDVVGYNC